MSGRRREKRRGSHSYVVFRDNKRDSEGAQDSPVRKRSGAGAATGRPRATSEGWKKLRKVSPETLRVVEAAEAVDTAAAAGAGGGGVIGAAAVTGSCAGKLLMG